jgi:hypothetical protein
MKIKTRMGQASHLGKHEAAAQMIRLVRELRDQLDEAGLLEAGDWESVANTVFAFHKTLPKKVREDLYEG